MNSGQPIYLLNTVFSFKLLQRYPTLMSGKPVLLMRTDIPSYGALQFTKHFYTSQLLGTTL